MIKQLFPNLDQDALLDIWPSYVADEAKILHFCSTNISGANIALNSILTNDEKKCLEKLFFDEKSGWYRQIDEEGMIKLKLAGMGLNLTNSVFTFDQMKNKKVLHYVGTLPESEQLLVAACYAKQKAVTYVTMLNYLKKVKKTDKMSILLYRGLRGKYNGEKYLFAGMECWTTSIDIAIRFTRGNGYVLQKEYPINQLFAGNRSTFKNKPNGIYRHNGFYVRREHEIIVENIEAEYETSGNVRLIMDGEII